MRVGRVISQEGALKAREQARKDGKRVVFTNGCFDILHPGHAEYLKTARGLGDVLIIGVNNDSSVRRIKGPRRPIMPLEDRMAVLACLECVDYVMSFDEDTPGKLIDMLVPDILAKGGDWEIDQVVGRDTVEQNGGRVAIIDFVEGYSTRAIIDSIVEKYCPEGKE